MSDSLSIDFLVLLLFLFKLVVEIGDFFMGDCLLLLLVVPGKTGKFYVLFGFLKSNNTSFLAVVIGVKDFLLPLIMEGVLFATDMEDFLETTDFLDFVDLIDFTVLVDF